MSFACLFVYFRPNSMNRPMARQAGSGAPSPIKSLVQIGIVTVVTIGLLLAFSRSAFFQNYPAYRQSAALVLWMYIPTMMILLRRRPFALYGITLKGWKASLLAAGSISLITIPPYVLAFYLFETLVHGASFQLTLPEALPAKILSLTLFIGLPEEYFFRGYLQTELDNVLGKPYGLFRIHFGFGLIIAALLFGGVHTLLGAGWPGLLTTFSALLFGWLREKTGSILAPTLYHGLGNLVYLTLVESIQ